MATTRKSNNFTNGVTDPLGPPMIGALLRVPWESVRRRMLERLHEHGFAEIDAAHLNVLLYPGPQGARPTELAARLRMSKQALNYLLRNLETWGYVERQPDPVDTRSKRIALTPRGVLMGQTIRDAVSEIEGEWRTQLGAERFAQLTDLLRELDAPV